MVGLCKATQDQLREHGGDSALGLLLAEAFNAAQAEVERKATSSSEQRRGPASSTQTASSADADPRKPLNPRASAPASRRHRREAVEGSAGAGFSLGDAVEVIGLVSEAGAALNGQTGQIVGRSDESGRWCVKFDDVPGSKQIKECNLRLVHIEGRRVGGAMLGHSAGAAFAIGDEVMVAGLVSERGAALNGQIGHVIGYSAASCRWCVHFPGSAEGKQIKENNLRLCKTDGECQSQLQVLGEFLHYAEPFDVASPRIHGLHQVESAIELCYVGCAVVYCDSKEEAATVNELIRKTPRWNRDGGRCAAITDGVGMPFERSRIITLINFGVAPSLEEYKRRVQRVFATSQDWPRSEPRGLVVNLVPSPLSPPYTKLNMDPRFDAPSWPGGRPTPCCSVFRVNHPESLRSHRANTFEKPSEYRLLERAGGIAFKEYGDEADAGWNINEWHLVLGHYSGERKYMYMRHWSWAG